jgi:hypothetical protein
MEGFHLMKPPARLACLESADLTSHTSKPALTCVFGLNVINLLLHPHLRACPS